MEELPGKEGWIGAGLAVEVGAGQIKGPGVNVELEGLPECPESRSITAVYMRWRGTPNLDEASLRLSGGCDAEPGL